MALRKQKTNMSTAAKANKYRRLTWFECAHLSVDQCRDLDNWELRRKCSDARYRDNVVDGPAGEAAVYEYPCKPLHYMELRDIINVINDLPVTDKQRWIMLLCALGFTHGEIAVRRGCKRQIISREVANARQAIRSEQGQVDN